MVGIFSLGAKTWHTVLLGTAISGLVLSCQGGNFYGAEQKFGRTPNNKSQNPDGGPVGNVDPNNPDGNGAGPKNGDPGAGGNNDGTGGTGEGNDDPGGTGGTDADGNPKDLVAPPIVAPAIDAVKKTCSTSPKSTLVQKIVLAKPTQTCKWETEGNGAKLDQSIRARFKQDVILKVPNNATLCNMSFSFVNQPMRYDDEIFLLYNNVVLMMSTNYADPSVYPDSLKSDADGLISYNWDRLYLRKYGHDLAGDYCLGQGTAGSACSIPATETTGQMLLGFNQDLVMKLGRLTAQLKFDEYTDPSVDNFNPKLNILSIVTTGDNDDSDCIHTDFSFDVTIDYVKP
jgi:hypothetical protein